MAQPFDFTDPSAGAAALGGRRATALLSAIGGAWPGLLLAQGMGRPLRIAFLPAASAPRPGRFSAFAAIEEGLRARGHSDLQAQAWFADGQVDRLPALTQQVLQWNPDLIVTNLTRAVVAMSRATRSVPIVMAGSGDQEHRVAARAATLAARHGRAGAGHRGDRMMPRLTSVLGALAAVALGGLPSAAAQPSGRVLKLGWLRPNAAGPAEARALGIPAALKCLGWVEGQNLIIERRWAGGHAARLSELARELVQIAETRQAAAVLELELSVGTVRGPTTLAPLPRSLPSVPRPYSSSRKLRS